MALPRSEMKWNGWGRNGEADPLGPRREAVFGWLMRLLNVETLPETPAAPLAQSIVPTATLPASIVSDLSALIGAEHVAVDDATRARFARGQSYHDLLWLRSGALDLAPDLVVRPGHAEDVAKLLEYAGRQGIACIPRGGGTSVVGGATAAPGRDHAGAMVIDLAGLDAIHEIREMDRLARIGAGCDGPALEQALAARGVTLGHFPQSFEFSTLGGWIAHCGAGHESFRYGRAAEWFHSAHLATPTGLWRTDESEASAAGPRLRELVVGSEGLFGIITDATVHIRRLPETRCFRAYRFNSFGDGLGAIREIVQSGTRIATLRLSDAAATAFYQGLEDLGSSSPRLLRRLAEARSRRLDAPSSFIVVAEGKSKDAQGAMEEARRVARAHGGIDCGARPARDWHRDRFRGPYLRDPLLDRGLGMDMLETAIAWSKLPALYAAVTSALTESMEGHGICLGTVTQAYSDGANLLFNYVFVRDLENPVRQWRRIKAAALDAIIAAGGTISHNHGVGQDHLPWIAKERDAASLSILRAVKRRLDPNGILNPGKLIPAATSYD